MNALKIIPIILSGGTGTRLWPVSRAAMPKQFQNFGNSMSMLQRTLTRCNSPLFDSRPIIVSALEHRGMLLGTLQSINVESDIILEPCQRSSCAAIMAGALHAIARDPDALVLVLAIDHHIPDEGAFKDSIARATEAARKGEIITFGIKPQSAATGYGYILPLPGRQTDTVTPVQQFVEKPDADTARRLAGTGYLWNSGNLLFRAATFVEEVRVLAPEIFSAVTQSLRDAVKDPDFIRLSHGAFSKSPAVSVDVAILEKTSRASVLPVSYHWHDLGTWDSIAETLPFDENKNSMTGEGMIVACRNVVIQSDTIMTAVVGCDDLIVITTSDAVLIVRRGASEGVKSLTEKLRQDGKDGYL